MNNLLIRIVLACLIGIVLIAYPDLAAAYLVITVGVLFIVPSLFSLLQYFRQKRSERPTFSFLHVGSIGSILLGLWLVINPLFFVNMLVILLGLVLLLGGIQQILGLWQWRRYVHVPKLAYIMPVLVFLAGVVTGVLAIFNPTEIRRSLFIFIGCICLIYAISNITNWLLFGSKNNKHRNNLGENNNEGASNEGYI